MDNEHEKLKKIFQLRKFEAEAKLAEENLEVAIFRKRKFEAEAKLAEKNLKVAEEDLEFTNIKNEFEIRKFKAEAELAEENLNATRIYYRRWNGRSPQNNSKPTPYSDHF